MDKFVAELTGEADGHKISREFGHLKTAVDWLQGEALSAFSDQAARGEVTLDGAVVWARSHLRNKAQAESDQGRVVRHVLARLGMADKYRKR